MRRRALLLSASSFNPTKLPGLALWHAPHKIPGLSDGAAIASLTDFGPNANHNVQATGSKQPVFRAAIQNGLGVARYDGIDDVGQSTALVNVMAGDYSLYVVMSETNGQVGFSFSPAVSSTNEIFEDGANNSIYGFQGVYSTQIPWDCSGVFRVLSLLKTGTNATGRVNGAQSGTSSDWKSFASEYLFIGYRARSNANYQAQDIAEFILYNRLHDAATAARVERYLGRKWGLPVP